MNNKASIPKGTRDFSPKTMRKRNYVFQKMKTTFGVFGFEQIETPSMEKLETLTGKYGEEGDQLIFKILKSGDFLSKALIDKSTNSKSLTPQISDKALRYDLTVPFARYVAQNRNDIAFPFRRFQMQNVWRADRPQKGRFREFYQCDADIIGTNSLIAEIELVQLYDDVFDSLGLKNITIKINNRKILSGIAQVVGEEDKIIDITVALDKLDKIGEAKVKEEMYEKGISRDTVAKMDILFNLNGTNSSKLINLKNFLKDSDIGLEGIYELSQVVNQLEEIQLKCATLDIDVTLARGLNYYTGAIFEVEATDVSIGSIGGGGRYDDLTGIFGFENMSGVGISFGFDRICIVLEALDLFTKFTEKGTQVLFVNFGKEEANYCLNLLKKLRSEGIKSEIYPSATNMKKQMQYADRKNVKYVLLVGENEMRTNTITVKNMFDGSQKNVTFEQLLLTIK
ncbi:MAG: histidine--tRNA ligase [Bacteroidota bacterium]|nr:histidine--tRNA ligase [Bacteroidota bacterium]